MAKTHTLYITIKQSNSISRKHLIQYNNKKFQNNMNAFSKSSSNEKMQFKKNTNDITTDQNINYTVNMDAAIKCCQKALIVQNLNNIQLHANAYSLIIFFKYAASARAMNSI